MVVLFFVVILTLAALAVHVGVWRLAAPRLHTRALAIIFLGVLAAGLGASFSGLLPHLSAIEAVHVALTYVVGGLAYICFYSAIEENSPSTLIVEFTAAAGTDGRQLDEYRTIINDDLLIGSRFHALLRDGFVREQSGTYDLTAKGVRTARIFTATSRLLDLSGTG